MTEKGRFILFPPVNPEIWEFYRKAVASFWTPAEIDFAVDVTDWTNKLNDSERHFISHVLAFFASSDSVVTENLAIRMMSEDVLKGADYPIPIAEVRLFYGSQIFMEGIHSEVYSLSIDVLIKDDAEKAKLFNAIDTIPVVKKKAEWALRWIERSDVTFAERLVSFACVEGIHFSGSFCALFWLKKRGGIMPGLCFSNELISRDEALHCDFACLLFKQYTKRPDLTHIVREAVEIEKEFITSALSVALIGMNIGLMTTYIEFCADRLLVALGLSKIYCVCNPFSWMELISLNGKSNFFEKRVSEYARAGMTKSTDRSESPKIFSLEEEF